MAKGMLRPGNEAISKLLDSSSSIALILGIHTCMYVLRLLNTKLAFGNPLEAKSTHL